MLTRISPFEPRIFALGRFGLVAAALAASLSLSACGSQSAAAPKAPASAQATPAKAAVPAKTAPAKVYLVNFTARWCPNCKVLEPKLVAARAALARQGAPVEEVRIDFTDDATLKASLPNVEAKGVAPILEHFGGITGLVVLAAADNGEPIDCINRQFSTEAIVNFANSAVERVATTAPGQRFLGGAVCPPPAAQRAR